MAVSWVEYPSGKAKLRMWFKVKVLYFQITVLHKLIQDISGGSSDISAIETCTRADTAFTLSLTSCNSEESLTTFSQPLHLSTFSITARVELTGLLLPLSLGFPSGSDSEDSPAMQETWVWSLAHEDPLEKELATHSSILAWRILWTEESGGLEAMGWQRIRQDWVTNTHTHIHHLVCTSPVAQIIKNLLAVQETRIWSLGWEDLLEKGMATPSSILAGEFHGQRNLARYSPWCHKESDATEQLTLFSFPSNLVLPNIVYLLGFLPLLFPCVNLLLL